MLNKCTLSFLYWILYFTSGVLMAYPSIKKIGSQLLIINLDLYFFPLFLIPPPTRGPFLPAFACAFLRAAASSFCFFWKARSSFFCF